MKLLKKNNVTAMIVAMGLVTGLTGTALASASGYWTITPVSYTHLTLPTN